MENISALETWKMHMAMNWINLQRQAPFCQIHPRALQKFMTKVILGKFGRITKDWNLSNR